MHEKEDNSKFNLVTKDQFSPVKMLNEQKEEKLVKNGIKPGWIKNTMKKSIEKNKIIYYLNKNNTDEIILTAKKTGMFTYSIRNPINKEVFANIKSNIFSNQFSIYDNQKSLIMKINFNINILGFGGPMKMEVLLDPNNSRDENGHFINKTPTFSTIYKCYVLKFIDRTIKSSTKNFQLINIKNENDIFLQFALCDDNKYILDYKAPFNVLTAFAVGIVTLSQKMLCEQIKD